MTKIYLFCKGATARAKVEGQITAKAVGLPVEILWDADWQPLRRILKVRCGDVERSVELGSRKTGIIPWECLTAGQMLEIGLDGWDEDGSLRIPTNWAKCEIVRQSVADADGDAAQNPTPPEASGMPGEDGGYYTPSVDSDGNLTWTASREDMPAAAGANIKGPKGDTGAQGPQGTQGPKGDTGDQGPQGDTGAKGDKGDKGDTGAAGYTPVRGVDYWTEADKQEIIDSIPSGGTGAGGEDGGYYIPSVDSDGNLSWAASKSGMQAVSGANIKGPQGQKGDTGAQGPKGDTGAKGDTGEKGDTGAAGYTPVKGTDYWTAAERQAMIDDVLAAIPVGDEVSY